jgi:hypothetical protein
VAKQYAGALGMLAFATIVLRSTIHTAAPASDLGTAVFAMFFFAALGWVVGAIADATVTEGVRTQFLAELTKDERESART